ncbi:MAG: NAD(P)H-dependent glycerol-3-phosphate dehydrogenase [Nanoarchaeota archaeon]|nr:NAD(P)H-dependent glycerol-3-phosphate dehydrogenase [Nanoarchaeota archaeon]
MTIAVLGAGSWGTTLANLLAENNPKDEVLLWAREPDVIASIKDKHENTQYLPGIKLSSRLKVTGDLKEALAKATVIVTAIPSQFLRQTAKQIAPFVKDATVVNVAKGIELKSFKRMSEVLAEELPKAKIAVLSGPNHAEEVSRKILTATVIASKDADLKMLEKLFDTEYFKVYPHDDIVGLEIAGAVKNITALATGIIAGLGMGDNATGSIVTLGLREMIRVGRHFGAREETFYGLAGIGDLVATCTSQHSRNRKAGLLIAKGMDFDAIQKEMHGMVAEGIMTCKALHEYAEKEGINLPLTAQMYSVLFEKKKLKDAIKDLKELI